MTPKVPKARCKRCRHYNEWYGCHLDDLTPCPYHRELKPWQVFLRVTGIELGILVVVILVIILLKGCSDSNPTEFDGIKQWSAVELLRNQHKEELSEWQKFQLAIIWTESKANPAAIGKDNDGGLYQMVPIYVEEVNRVCGTSYTHADVFDPDKAIEIFNAMQGYYNPDKDFDTALRYHNRSEAYKRTVMQNYELICRMEEVRAKLIAK